MVFPISFAMFTGELQPTSMAPATSMAAGWRGSSFAVPRGEAVPAELVPAGLCHGSC